MTTSRDESRAHGQRPDPFDPRVPKPNRAVWPGRRLSAFMSEAMQVYRTALCLPWQSDVRAAVLDDLSTYFGIDEDECVRRCVNRVQGGGEEWEARRRETPEAPTGVSHTTMSSSFDLLWCAYLQAEGYAYPMSIVTARGLPQPVRGGRHLDFGAGVGVTSQLFLQLGYESDLADVSTSRLAFAKFRLERRSAAQSASALVPLGTIVRTPGACDRCYPYRLIRSIPGDGPAGEGHQERGVTRP